MAKEGGPPSFRGVFIRAPGILEVGPEVQVLAEVLHPSDRPAKRDASESLEVNPLALSLESFLLVYPVRSFPFPAKYLLRVLILALVPLLYWWNI